jgi:DNA mismatch repair ATPase MutL
VLLEAAPVAEMSREVLDGARVVAQWGKKFVLAVSAAGDLFAVDQHAAVGLYKMNSVAP